MAKKPEETQQPTTLPKVVSVQDDGLFYSNCSMIETSPFDISILFGKVRRRSNEKGEQSLVEVYERQVYVSHLQARALYEALGRSLHALSQQQGGSAVAPAKPEK
jgi:hypothetical protein